MNVDTLVGMHINDIELIKNSCIKTTKEKQNEKVMRESEIKK